MMHTRPRHLLLCALVSLVSLGSTTHSLAAPGSWVATAPRFTIASSQLDSHSVALIAPDGQSDSIIDSVSWQYRVPPGTRMEARLCLQHRCQRLAAPRGISHDFAGLSASGPFEFRFRLAVDQPPVVVEAMKLIVNHR